MHLRDIAVYREQYEKKRANSKSYYVCLIFFLLISGFHIILDIKTSLDITLAIKWAILAVLSLLGIATFNRRKLNKINLHVIFVFITVVFIPYSFITSGGQLSFVQYFMILYLVLMFFIMKVKAAAIYAIYNFIQLETLYILESQYPSLVKTIDVNWFILDNAVTIPILMIIMVALVTILLVLYKSDEEKIQRYNLRLRRDAKLKNTMLDITYTVTQNYERSQLTQTILGRLIDSMESAEQGSLIMIDRRKAYYDSTIGYDLAALKDVVIPVQETYLYKATDGAMDKAVIISSSDRMAMDQDKDSIFDQVKFFYSRMLLCAPITLHNKIWGILNIESQEGMVFTDKDKEFIRVFTNEIEKVLSFSVLLEQNQKLRNNDYLTNIYNRYYFTTLAENTISNPNNYFAFISCDLDDFKNVNDTYGHMLGDDYLKYFVAIVSTHLTKDDIFGRTGGDEFQIIMQGKSVAEADMVMQEITASFAKRPVILKRNRVTLKFSYGISLYTGTQTLKDIIHNSDQAMYKNKHINKINDTSEQWNYII